MPKAQKNANGSKSIIDHEFAKLSTQNRLIV
jgi:hypothetical protein